MELMPRYQLTPAGAIPYDWRFSSARRIGDIPYRTLGSTLHKSDYTPGGIPLMNPMHIVEGKLFSLRIRWPCPTENPVANRLGDFTLQGLVTSLSGRRGELGRCAVVRNEHAGWLVWNGLSVDADQGQPEARVSTTGAVEPADCCRPNRRVSWVHHAEPESGRVGAAVDPVSAGARAAFRMTRAAAETDPL